MITTATPTDTTPTITPPAPTPSRAKAFVAEAAEVVNETSSTATDAATNASDKAASALKTGASKVETLVAETQKTVTEQFEKLSKGIEGLTAFSQENFDAMTKSSEIAAKAAEGISSELSAYSKKSFEDVVSAAQDLASAKTITELFEKQTAFAQSAFEGYVAQTTKMHEILVAATKDVTAPLGARVTAATERMKSFAL
jgi:phasin family protein